MRTLPTILLLILGTVAFGQQFMFSDEFEGASLDARWDTSNLNVDSHINLSGGRLLLDASPLNNGSDYFDQTNHRAPRIMQPVCGDWFVATKLTVAPLSGDYQDVGFMLFTGDTGQYNNDQRIMMRRWRAEDCPPDFQDFRLLYQNICEFDANTMWMTLEHKGDSIIGRVSADSVNWYRRALYDTSDFRYVGLISVRQPWNNDLGLRTQAYFDYFRVLDTDTLHIVSAEGPFIGVGNALHLSVDTVSSGAYAWYGPNGDMLSDSASLTVDPVVVSDAGWYHVSVSRVDCQFLTDSFFVDVSTGLDGGSFTPSGIRIYPSPANDAIHIQFASPFDPTVPMEVFDAMGRKMQLSAAKLLIDATGITSMDIPVAGLAPGAYFVNLRSMQFQAHGKFIKR